MFVEGCVRQAAGILLGVVRRLPPLPESWDVCGQEGCSGCVSGTVSRRWLWGWRAAAGAGADFSPDTSAGTSFYSEMSSAGIRACCLREGMLVVCGSPVFDTRKSSEVSYGGRISFNPIRSSSCGSLGGFWAPLTNVSSRSTRLMGHVEFPLLFWGRVKS